MRVALEGYQGRFDHTAIGGVTAQFGHVMSYGATKGVRIENKVRDRLSLKYFFKKD